MRFYELQSLPRTFRRCWALSGSRPRYAPVPVPAPAHLDPAVDRQSGHAVLPQQGRLDCRGSARAAPAGELTAWPLETPKATLVDIAGEAARASIERRPLRSPYCWGRAEHSVITGLADALVGLGVEAGAIHVPRALVPDIEVNKLVGDGGHLERLVLQEEMRAAQVEVALRPTLGWTADLEVHNDPGRPGSDGGAEAPERFAWRSGRSCWPSSCCRSRPGTPPSGMRRCGHERGAPLEAPSPAKRPRPHRARPRRDRS